MNIGPDAARYLAVARGRTVSRPFHLRRLLPYMCGVNPTPWWSVWCWSWPTAAAGFIAWRMNVGDSWQVAATGCVLLLALPGILGPSAVIPVGVDLPATAYTLCGVALASAGGWHWIPAAVLLLLAAGIKETAPVFAALWLWSPLPLLALVVPAVVALCRKPGADPLGPQFDAIAERPIRHALLAHAGKWRNGWVMVAPWGVCLLALHAPGWSLLACLAVAYGQLLVATDTVRLYQHAAGPVMAAAAAPLIPAPWVPLVLAVHVLWWRTPERI